MGVSSDVGIALRHNAKLSGDAWDFLRSADETHTHAEGALYIFENVKWYDTYEDVGAFLTALRENPPETYFLVEACMDYPDSDATEGEWVDNPWGLSLEQVVKLHYR